MTAPLSDEQFDELEGTFAITDRLALEEMTAVFGYARWHRAELARARADIAKLRDAIEDLMAWQNGPPLVKYEKGWTAAMEKANAVLAATATPDAGV